MKIEIRKTANVETLGNKDSKNVIVALHGYGQLSRYFIRKFDFLVDKDFFIVAPEGLHRFYLKGASGRVGASWMTKEERKDDIEDYINYLNDVVDGLDLNQYDRKVILGFSQGGATASRWHEAGNFLADDFVLWGSVFPPDVNLPDGKHSKFESSNNSFLIGDQDEYYSEEQRLRTFKAMESMNKGFDCIEYEGTHNIYPIPLKQVLGI